MIRRYPHQLLASRPDHLLNASFLLPRPLSQVLKAQGTKSSSAALLISGSAKIEPASLHPPHPDHSTKLAKIGLPVDWDAERALAMSPCPPSSVRLTYLIVPSSTSWFGGGGGLVSSRESHRVRSALGLVFSSYFRNVTTTGLL